MKQACIVATIGLLLMAAGTRAADGTASGKLTLQEAEGITDDTVFKVTIKTRNLRGDCTMYIGKFMGRTTIWAGVYLKNVGKEPLYYVYNVAFFDKHGKLVCSKQENASYAPENPNEPTLVNSWVTLPVSEIARIVSFKASLYESKTKPGT